jgi:hypothetical protein
MPCCVTAGAQVMDDASLGCLMSCHLLGLTQPLGGCLPRRVASLLPHCHCSSPCRLFGYSTYALLGGGTHILALYNDPTVVLTSQSPGARCSVRALQAHGSLAPLLEGSSIQQCPTNSIEKPAAPASAVLQAWLVPESFLLCLKAGALPLGPPHPQVAGTSLGLIDLSSNKAPAIQPINTGFTSYDRSA